MRGNQEAYREMQNFLEALDSYPESFTRNPGVSFEEHHRALIPAKRSVFGRARQNGATRRKAEAAQFPTL